ncbi:unnamed protein product [Mycena citricolor]|uniref:Uncharacterized protein n=1 Tax=Mycena citricolor TaxID=2018698 RepID=A0AAD2Q281_9AGAR|nr:unnamed protein product [Mycena citricolor]
MISPLPITIMHIIRSSPSSSDTIRRRTIPNFFSFGTRKPAPPPKPFISSSSLSSVSSTSHEAKSPPGSLDIAGAGFERQVVLSEEQREWPSHTLTGHSDTDPLPVRNPPETFSNDLAAILLMDPPAKPSQTVTGVCFRKEVLLTEEERQWFPQSLSCPTSLTALPISLQLTEHPLCRKLLCSHPCSHPISKNASLVAIRRLSRRRQSICPPSSDRTFPSSSSTLEHPP